MTHRKQTPLNALSRLPLYLIAGALCSVFVLPQEAQILQGKWVDESQAAIEEHRKTEVAVVVLDGKDQPLQGAKVRLKQQRHDFVLGLKLPKTRMPPHDSETLPVFRCFNAIAMDRYTDWSAPSRISPQMLAKRLGAWQHAIDPAQIHFGPVVSADPARNNDRLSLLESDKLRDAVLARIDLAAIFEPTPDRYDLYADVLSQDFIERKLGQGMLHRMFDRASAKHQQASFGFHVRDALTMRRGRDLVSLVQKLEVRQVDFDHVTLEQSYPDPLQPIAMKRLLDDYVRPLPVPATLASVEVGGSTPLAAAINLETLLRLTFAQPKIEGIYFAGVKASDVLQENAELIDSDGKPTAAGEAMDTLFTELWHSDVADTTDERGNVTTRVFTGWYEVSATLPDGSVLQTEVYLPKSDRAKVVVLQVTAAEAK